MFGVTIDFLIFEFYIGAYFGVAISAKARRDFYLIAISRRANQFLILGAVKPRPLGRGYKVSAL